MKKYHYHPDKFVIITNNDKVYVEAEKLAKFDLQQSIIQPLDGSTEFQYIQGYGTRNFNRGDMISFSEDNRPDLNDLIDNIDVFIERKKIRESVDPSLWEIPEDMKVYNPPLPPEPELPIDPLPPEPPVRD